MARRRDRRYDVAGLFNVIRGIGNKRKEAERLQEEGSRKNLLSSLGSAAGGLLVGALTGGAVNPVTLALLTGAGSYVGGKIGSNQEKINPNRYRYLKEDAEEFTRYIDQNIKGSALKSGTTAGLTQATNLARAGEGWGDMFSMDFQSSAAKKALNILKHRSRVNELANQGLVTLDDKGRLITSPDKLGAESTQDFMKRFDMAEIISETPLVDPDEFDPYNLSELPSNATYDEIQAHMKKSKYYKQAENVQKERILQQEAMLNELDKAELKAMESTKHIGYDMPLRDIRRSNNMRNIGWKPQILNRIPQADFNTQAIKILDRLKLKNLPSYTDNQYFDIMSDFYKTGNMNWEKYDAYNEGQGVLNNLDRYRR